MIGEVDAAQLSYLSNWWCSSIRCFDAASFNSYWPVDLLENLSGYLLIVLGEYVLLLFVPNLIGSSRILTVLRHTSLLSTECWQSVGHSEFSHVI